MRRLVIAGRFDTMNDYIRENRSGWNGGNQMKHKNQMHVLAQIKRQLREPLHPPCIFHFRFYRSDKRTDPDNIMTFFTKVFLDALVQGGYLKNDGWRTVLGFTSKFLLDTPDRVVVEIEEEVT